MLGGAAGHGDPLTGSLFFFLIYHVAVIDDFIVGTQYGLEAAKIAADTIIDALTADDLSENFLKQYHLRCTTAFGWDFFWYVCFTTKLIYCCNTCTKKKTTTGLGKQCCLAPVFLRCWTP